MKLIVSNHKMNLTKEEIIQYVDELKNIKSTKSQLVFCPSFPYLPYFNGDGFFLGSQNVASYEKKNLTGEVSADQLKSLGVKYGIVGHSERRNDLKESLEEIRKKVTLLLKNNMIPILCIGEKLEEIEERKKILKNQIDGAFLDNCELEKIVVAYEPVWAIGTGKIPALEEIKDTINFIKSYISENYHVECKVLYGGSVNEENIKSLESIENMDGYLIGGTSLKIESLKKVIEEVEEFI